MIASSIFAIVTGYILRESQSDRERLKDLLEELDAREKGGVEAIKKKREHNPAFWKSLLEESRTSFDLVAHAGNRWTGIEYGKSFSENLKRIAEAKGKVRLLFMKPGGVAQKRVSAALKTDYEERINSTLAFILLNVRDALHEDYRDNIEVKWFDERDFPYMMIQTDRQVVVSPYLAKTSSEENLVIVLQKNKQFALSFEQDFQLLFRNSERVTWEQVRNKMVSGQIRIEKL